MRGFIIGVIVTLLIVFGGAYFYATTGHFDMRAVGPAPSHFERHAANESLDEWVDDHAPKQANPFQPTMQNLTDGSNVYDKNCSLCHGSLKEPVSPMRRKFYPSVPQLTTSTPDDPDGSLFYVVKYGIRFSGMPGWDGVLSDDDIWRSVLFIKNSDKLKNSPQQQSPQELQQMNNGKQPEKK
jgi:thiosulfate dehydrogenase